MASYWNSEAEGGSENVFRSYFTQRAGVYTEQKKRHKRFASKNLILPPKIWLRQFVLEFFVLLYFLLIKCLFSFIYYPTTGILFIFRYVLFLPYQEYFEIYSSYYFLNSSGTNKHIPSGIVSFSSFEPFLMCGIFEAVHMGKKINNINSEMNIVCVRLC